MRKSLIIATLAVLALATAGVSTGSAQGRGNGGGGGHGANMGSNQGGHLTGLERADASAGTHGAQGRAIARQHGANKVGFCPPGQAKKAGKGSRFQC